MTLQKLLSVLIYALFLVAGAATGVALHGCANPYAPGILAADGLKIALGGYQLHTHGARREITAKAHATCDPLPTDAAARACFEAALAPFEAKQRPVLACIAVAEPVVRGVEAAALAKDVKAAQALLPDLVAKAASCGLVIVEATKK